MLHRKTAKHLATILGMNKRAQGFKRSCLRLGRGLLDPNGAMVRTQVAIPMGLVLSKTNCSNGYALVLDDGITPWTAARNRRLEFQPNGKLLNGNRHAKRGEFLFICFAGQLLNLHHHSSVESGFIYSGA